MGYSKNVVAYILVIFLCWSVVINNIECSQINSSHSSSLFINSMSISIQNDTAFSLYGLPGNGTKNNPFRIENLNISTNNTMGIEIINTTMFFLIQNCYIRATTYGIYIDNVSQGTAQIVNNTCTDHIKHGITISNSDATTVLDNNCSDNDWHGIVFSDSNEHYIANNYCSNNVWIGLFLTHSNFSNVLNNTCNNNFRGGLLLDDSYHSNVESNTCQGNDWQGGIRLHTSKSSRVVNNTCKDNLSANIRIIESNNSEIIDNYCFGIGNGINILESGNCTAQNNLCSNLSGGFLIRDSELSKIVENQFINCGLKLIEDNEKDYLSYEITSNWVNEKLLGYFTNKKNFNIKKDDYGQIILVNCSEASIQNQIITNTRVALSLYFSDHIIIKNCISNYQTEGGIHLYQSNNIEIFNSTCSFNGLYGILAESSTYNSFTYNTFESNFLWGIVLDLYSSYNSIHHNSFHNNNQYYSTSQAKDDGNNNMWHYEKEEEGNYWENYSGVGNYSIDGTAGTVDPYPLSEPPVYRNNNIYYSFLSLVVLIPLTVFGYFRFSSKRKR